MGAALFSHNDYHAARVLGQSSHSMLSQLRAQRGPSRHHGILTNRRQDSSWWEEKGRTQRRLDHTPGP